MSRYQNLLIEIERCKPRTILEVGTWNGKHASEMIEIASIDTPKDDIVYYGFDLWEELTNTQYYKEFLHPKKVATKQEAETNLRKTGVEFHLIQGNTVETLSCFRPEFPIDFVFIDGGHSVPTIKSDWKNIERIIHSKSVILFDDYCKNDEEYGCYSIIEEIIESNRYDVHLLKPIEYFERAIQMVKVSLVNIP